MANFKITDKRGLRPQLITKNLSSEMSAIRNQGTTPSHPQRKNDYVAQVNETVAKRGLSKLVQASDRHGAATDGERAVVNEMRSNRMSRTASDLTLAMPKQRRPLESLKAAGIPTTMEKEKDRAELRGWSRAYYATHYLVPLCIDIYARFPLQGMELTCRDPDLKKFYEQLFFEDLDYENFLVDMGREFWTVGEVNSLANFNEVLGVWDSEEIINPDDIEAQFSPFEKDPRIKLGIPLYLRELIQNPEQSQKWEADIIRRDFPEIVTAISQDKKLDVSPVLMSRIINRMTPWDVYGTPHMLRGFKLLMMEESLNAAQDAVADRLYAPFILAKLGIQDMGDGGGPWIPDQGELDTFRDDMNQALSADFKLMVHHFGVDIKSVFGRENMPRFDGDYDRIERKLLQIWGIGESLISGSNQGSYASSALNRDLVTQLMSTYQKWIIRHYKKRALIVAEAQGHFDYESSGGLRVPIYEEIFEVDEETGEERVVERPKLLIPDLKFKALSLQDESTERQFLQTLKSSGFPISDRTLAVNIPIDFDEELEKVQDEKVMKIVAEAETKKKAEEVLKSRNLPVPDEVRDPKEVAKEKAKDQEKAMKAQQAITGIPGGAGDVASADADDTPDKAIADVTSPPKTPNVAPVDDGAKDDTATDDTKPADSDKDTKGKSKDKKLPRSKTRPAISDEKKKGAPKPNKKTARFDRGYTASQGWRDNLTREEVEDLVNGHL